MLRQAFFPELDQPVSLYKVIVFLFVIFPDNRPVVENVFLSLFERPFCSLDNSVWFSPARFTRPVSIKLVRFIGYALYLIHNWLKPFVGCEEIGVLHYLDETVVILLQKTLLVGFLEHYANVVDILLKKDTCILLERAWFRILVSSVYG